MSDVLNPVSVEQKIAEIAGSIANSVSVCNDRYKAFVAAEDAYERAFARAYMSHEGPAHEKKYAAVLATTVEKDALNVADAAYRYADRQAKALDSELRAYQSVGASVRAMFSVAGRGAP